VRLTLFAAAPADALQAHLAAYAVIADRRFFATPPRPTSRTTSLPAGALPLPPPGCGSIRGRTRKPTEAGINPARRLKTASPDRCRPF
jgi:hypothetical protein